MKIRHVAWLKNLGIIWLATILAWVSVGCTPTVTAKNEPSLALQALLHIAPLAGLIRITDDVSEKEAAPVTLLWPLADINEKLKAYGKFLVGGIAESDYIRAMERAWLEVKPTGDIQDLSIELTKKYSFKDLELFMMNLARYEGVKLQTIGKRVEGRSIYSLSIDFEPKAIDTTNSSTNAKPALLFTGQVHGNEFAGSLYILKQFSELIKQAQSNENTRLLLERVRFDAIPIVNPDSREKNIADGSTTRRSNANGVDLNRNFPSVSGSQLGNGITRTPYVSTSPSLRYYVGPSLGSEPETKAVMKWLEVLVPTAMCLLDYHQQGRGLYYGKPWDTITGAQNNAIYGAAVINYLNTGVRSKQYSHIPNANNIGFNGGSGTITDYALAIARGLKYSPTYGILTLDVNGVDTPLLKFKDLDNCLEYYKPLNEGFCTATVEITKTEGLSNPLGYSAAARKLMHEEYYKYNYDKLLTFLAELALGMILDQ